VGALLRAIDGCEGQAVTRYALKLASLVFVRPSELRKAEWTEFNLIDGEWRVPGAKMKMRRPHRVPLAPPDDPRATTESQLEAFRCLDRDRTMISRRCDSL